MILTEKDYILLEDEILSKRDGCADIDREDEIFSFDYEVKTSFYIERETDGYITTDAVCYITNISCVNENGEQVYHNFDASKLARSVEQSLVS
jgi:hypothetical protein